jgi:hypothetical protein
MGRNIGSLPKSAYVASDRRTSEWRQELRDPASQAT